MRTDEDRAIALAGVFQAAVLAQQIAQTGMVDTASFEVSLNSIVETDPADVAGVYGNAVGIRLGLQTLIRQLDRPRERNLEITRHAVSLLQLAHRLSRDPKRLADLAGGIEAIASRREDHPVTHDNQVAALAELYQRDISTMTPRIMVSGEPLHLQNPANQHRIRAALLAGIRAGILWQQCEGSRWRLLFGRRALASAAQRLLAAA